MPIQIRLILSKEDHPEVEEEVFCFDKAIGEDALIGLSLVILE